MALYRCAACGSPNVVTDTQTGGIGYNYVKGAVGTVLLGVGGAAAGIQSKQEQVFRCPDCGLTMSCPMPEEMKAIIDLGVMSPDARHNLTLRGVPMEWKFLKQKFKNIEFGIGDELEADRKAHQEKMRNTPHSFEWQLHYDYATDEGKALLESLRPAFEAGVARQLDIWEERENAKAVEARAKAEKEEKERIERINFLTNKKASLSEEQKELHQSLSNLSFFKAKEKSITKKKIEAISHDISNISREIRILESEKRTEPESEGTAFDRKNISFLNNAAIITIVKLLNVEITDVQLAQILVYYDVIGPNSALKEYDDNDERFRGVSKAKQLEIGRNVAMPSASSMHKTRAQLLGRTAFKHEFGVSWQSYGDIKYFMIPDNQR